MIKLPTKNEERLKELRDQMRAVEMYSEEWFKIKEKYMALFQKIEKSRKQS